MTPIDAEKVIVALEDMIKEFYDPHYAENAIEYALSKAIDIINAQGALPKPAPKIKKGVWTKLDATTMWMYRTPALRSYVVNFIEETGEYRLLPGKGTYISPGGDKKGTFTSLEAAKSHVEKEYEGFVLNLIETEE